MLTDGKDVDAGRCGSLDGRERVVGTSRQVDDREIGEDKGPIEFGCRPGSFRRGTGQLRGPCQAFLPDQVLGEDRDPRRQLIVSARWWKTSRAVTTPVGRPSSMIGMWRKPPTAIL